VFREELCPQKRLLCHLILHGIPGIGWSGELSLSEPKLNIAPICRRPTKRKPVYPLVVDKQAAQAFTDKRDQCFNSDLQFFTRHLQLVSNLP
jgi:hypothetical protein